MPIALEKINERIITQKNKTMKNNMGPADRIIRLVVAIIIAVLYYMGILTGALGVVLLCLGGVFVLTSLFGVCPLYLLFGFSTCPVKKT